MALRTSLLCLALVSVAVAGCDSKGDKTSPTPATSSAAHGGSAGSAQPGKPAPKGLAATDNDPKVVALLKPVLGCPWEEGAFKYECADWKKWIDATDEFKAGAGDRTLVNLIEDIDEKVRYAASIKLDKVGEAYRTDKDLATRVIAAAEKEKAPSFMGVLGAIVAEIDFDKTGLWERVKTLAQKGDVHVRGGIVSHMLPYNGGFAPAVQLAMDSVKDPEKPLRLQSIVAFKKYAGAKKAEACKFLLDNVDNAEGELAVQAARTLAENPECGANLDGLLDSLEKRVKEKKVDEATWDWTIVGVCANASSNEKQKARAEALAKTLASVDTGDVYVRRAALDAVLKCDPAGGKAVLQGYANDKEDVVRGHVKELLSPKP